MDSYKLVIFDRFRDDVRSFGGIFHDGKELKCCGLDYNEDAQWWEFNITYTDNTSEIVKDKLLQYISECTYKED